VVIAVAAASELRVFGMVAKTTKAERAFTLSAGNFSVRDNDRRRRGSRPHFGNSLASWDCAKASETSAEITLRHPDSDGAAFFCAQNGKSPLKANLLPWNMAVKGSLVGVVSCFFSML
jgi:hypothetical protein